MVILIGGASQTGKTLMVQQLLEKYQYPYFSLDHLKMGLYRAGIGCGFTPVDSVEDISEKIWPILKGMIMTVIENKQNIIIEGCYLLPQRINELDDEYKKEIVSFHLGFSESYIEKHYEISIIHHRSAIESRGYDNDFTMEEYIADNKKLKALCSENNAQYFEIENDYQSEINQVYDWIDKKRKEAPCLKAKK